MGDWVDWNNDGLIDGSDQNGFISNFSSGSRGFTLSDRGVNGDVRLLFNADIDLGGTELEGRFSMSVSALAVPEPSSMIALFLRAARHCWMPNHIHALIQTPETNLARGMQHWLFEYANWYAKRNRRIGHLYQGRYNECPQFVASRMG